ncbi:DUF262 domain-containing protein, partial [Mycolicibacterium peregrinum]|uniref:DUF262 domain-containing protein n=1 Tax=Mycolicibacterium peregrinum TaxID=43304 RepID=UPI000AE1979E
SGRLNPVNLLTFQPEQAAQDSTGADRQIEWLIVALWWSPPSDSCSWTAASGIPSQFLAFAFAQLRGVIGYRPLDADLLPVFLLAASVSSCIRFEGDLDVADNDEIDTPSDEGDSSVPAAERKLVTQSYDLSVSTLIEQWNDETLILPDIQREYVWNNAKASRLIESLLLNVPIPVIYLAEAPGDRYEIIDGHQRVRSIARFVSNEFPLSGLQVISDPDHRGKRFHQIPTAHQRRIRTRVIRAIIITDESHPNMKFEVFERLNAGSVALNAQEIRNSTYRGAFMNRVKSDWVMNEDFRACINTKMPRGRMVDHELIIRVLALRHSLDTYRPPLPRFLNEYCRLTSKFTEDELRQTGETFARAARNVRTVYGPHAFRLTDANGKLIDRSPNRGLVEAQLVTLSYADEDAVSDLAPALRRNFGELHTNPEFLDYIQRAIVDRSRTIGRHMEYREACKKAGLSLDI